MKLYNIIFDTPQDYAQLNSIAKQISKHAIVTINAGSEGKSFETQEERVAQKITKELGGRVNVIEYDVRKIMK